MTTPACEGCKKSNITKLEPETGLTLGIKGVAEEVSQQGNAIDITLFAKHTGTYSVWRRPSDSILAAKHTVRYCTQTAKTETHSQFQGALSEPEQASNSSAAWSASAASSPPLQGRLWVARPLRSRSASWTADTLQRLRGSAAPHRRQIAEQQICELAAYPVAVVQHHCGQLPDFGALSRRPMRAAATARNYSGRASASASGWAGAC